MKHIYENTNKCELSCARHSTCRFSSSFDLKAGNILVVLAELSARRASRARREAAAPVAARRDFRSPASPPTPRSIRGPRAGYALGRVAELDDQCASNPIAVPPPRSLFMQKRRYARLDHTKFCPSMSITNKLMY